MAAVRAALAIVLLAAAAGCGGARHASAPPASRGCRTAAAALVEDGRRFLRHYGGGDPGPADQELYNVRNDLARLQRARCGPAQLGATLRAGLTAAGARRLAALSPRPIELNVRQALRCSEATKAAGCEQPAARFTETSFGPGAVNDPITP